MTPIEIKTIRKALGLTQQGLADALGVALRTYTDWERGVRPIPRTAELALSYLLETMDD